MLRPSSITIPDILRLTEQKKILKIRKIRLAFLLVGCLFILGWQLNFTFNADYISDEYKITASTGSRHEYVKRFTYFLYHLNIFPLISTKLTNFSTIPPTDDLTILQEEAGAEKIIKNFGDTLYMDTPNFWALRYGDLGRGYLYLLDALIKGSTIDLSVHPLHNTAFIMALLLLFSAFCWLDLPLLGMFTVLFLGSNPFALYEVYVNENIYGWVITSALIVLAINLPLLDRKKVPTFWLWLAPLLTGGFLGAIKHVRTEPTLIILSVICVYLTASQIKWRSKISLVLLLFLTFFGMKTGISRYFELKITEAVTIVKKAGGYPMEKSNWSRHGIWHPIWTGLGDFDTEYGYEWSDDVAYRYAIPIMKKKYNIPLTSIRRSHLVGMYLDPAKKYLLKMEDLSQYEIIMREKVLEDIGNDPLWYLGILLKRLGRIFKETTPVSLAWSSQSVNLPMFAFVVIPALLLLVYYQSWFLVKLIAFTFPLSLTPFIIYSGGGTTFYACFHQFLAAIILALLLEGALLLKQSRQ